jgi:SpoIID/LytB domain protein
LLAQIEKSKNLLLSDRPRESIHETSDSLIRWYDREDHQGFHVCADDHCQRYQGITRAVNPEVINAVESTRGEVLAYEEKICDARFSKCCGGVSEEFQHCWENKPHAYLKRVDDNPPEARVNMDDLKLEAHAGRFISGTPEAFCNTTDSALLKQVLNDYDQVSADFFRWDVEYSQEEISSLIREKSGRDFGRILDLLPLERGESGRLVRLKIVGEKRSVIVGKELEIRRWLSPSHLYSSAFIVKKLALKKGVPDAFRLRGAGWGHGVGLCQIGAAVMAHRGYSHEGILNHYFMNAEIEKLYE